MQKMRFNASQKIHIFGPFPSKICFAELAQQKNLYTKNLSKIREFFYCEEFIRPSLTFKFVVDLKCRALLPREEIVPSFLI